MRLFGADMGPIVRGARDALHSFVFPCGLVRHNDYVGDASCLKVVETQHPRMHHRTKSILKLRVLLNGNRFSRSDVIIAFGKELKDSHGQTGVP